MKNAGSRPKREIRDAGAQGLQAEREGRESLAAKALRPCRQPGSSGKADEDADRGPNPIAIKGQLQKPGHANKHGEDTDPVQELAPDPALQRSSIRRFRLPCFEKRLGSGGFRRMSGRLCRPQIPDLCLQRR